MKKITKQASYDERMKAKGLIKTCIWIDPDDFDHITEEGARSRRRLERKQRNGK